MVHSFLYGNIVNIEKALLMDEMSCCSRSNITHRLHVTLSASAASVLSDSQVKRFHVPELIFFLRLKNFAHLMLSLQNRH